MPGSFHSVFNPNPGGTGHGTVLPISHSGDTSDGAVNASLASYEWAYAQGFRHFQVDVVLTRDNVLLAKHAIFGRFVFRAPTVTEVREEKPETASLSELFAALPDARWNIEIKSVQAVTALIAVLETHRDTSGDEFLHHFFISSPFRSKVLRQMRAAFPGMATCATLIQGGLFGVPLWPGRIRHDAVQVWNVTRPRGWVLRWNHQRGIHVQVWGVRSEDAMRKLCATGIDAILTDEHALLSRVLEETAQ